METSPRSVSRRQALRMVGGAAGGAALLTTASGLVAPAWAALPRVTATLDKGAYQEGESMRLVVTENVRRPYRRRIRIHDSTGAIWTQVSDTGHKAVFTARAGAERPGENRVHVRVRRKPGGDVGRAKATYLLGALGGPAPRPTPTGARFAGDRPDRVMLGMAVTGKSNSNLQWQQAMTLLGAAGQYVSMRRCFVPGWITKASLTRWADWAESAGVYPVISFKVPGNDWAGVTQGRYDSDLNLLIATLSDRDKAGREQVCIAVHHEPAGDGSLALWARMQEYLSNKFAPYADVFCFTTISNGYDWGPYRGGTGEVAMQYPDSLIATLNRNRHILACDTYDSADPTNLDYSKYDRTSLKMGNFVAWARAKGVQRIGIGEFGCHDDIDMLKCWEIISRNRDIFAYASYFNSGQNSRADWRMIPTDYPPDPAVTSYRDTGGSAVSARRLLAGKSMLAATPK